MKLPSAKLLLLNGAILMVALGSLAFVAHSALIGSDPEPCSGRYLKGTRLALDREGAPIGASDLQARVAGTDWGFERTRIVRVKTGPARHVMEFDLSSAVKVSVPMGDKDKEDAKPKEGVGFHWIPSQARIGSSACLVYSVFLPNTFEFDRGGRLPGFLGLPVGEAGEPDAVAFSTRYSWRTNGAGDIHTQLPGIPEGRPLGNDKKGFTFPRGKWVDLEQELVLNDQGKRNGMLRVWVDGALRFQRTGLTIQDEKPARIAGVLADIMTTEREPPKDRKIWISAFEVRWN